jgi:hypothetical protein
MSEIWMPPSLAAVPAALEPGSLVIPHDFGAWTPPPTGFQPSWWPINAGQQAALSSPAEMLLYGGQSGGGKTDFLVGDAMQECHIPSFRGLLLRESLGELDQIGDRMQAAYEPLGARYRRRTGGGQWIFPSGARVRYGYLAQDGHLKRYRGNPYSWLGIDESGLHPGKRVRQMVAWLASVDRRLRVRARFTSNPGGVGHDWQMAVFLRNRCPLHFPAGVRDDRPLHTSVRAGKVYQGACWSWPPSPAEQVRMTTAFFPASVTENPLYGREKVDKLLSQTLEIQMQLLHGCWCNSASLYFGFLQPQWMVPFPAIGDEWWWNHFISIDYGYGNSSAAAGLFSVDLAGRIFGTGEMVEKKMGSVDFAKQICEKWIKPKMGSEPRRILFVTVDPANDNEDGTGDTNFELMQKVFAAHGVQTIKSHKNPFDNAQKLYHGLSNRLLVMTSMMPQAFNSLATRVIDDRRAVKKVHGDPADDLYDMTAYGYNTYLVEAAKPERLQIMERVQKMRESGASATDIARYNLQATQAAVEKQRQQTAGLPLRKTRKR